MAFNDPLVINGNDFHRIADGAYAAAVSTVDEPNTFQIKSDLKPSGISSFVIRRDVATNAESGGPDDALSVYMVVRGNFDKFDVATLAPGLAGDLNLFLGETGNMTKILRGEH